jgi:hydrogenase small subunit
MTTDAYAEHRRKEALTVHVLWIASGLGCDGESLAITSATSPSLEDLLLQTIPGAPRLVLHNPVLSYEVGDEFLAAFRDAEEDRLAPFILVLEGALGNERINGEGYWSGLGVTDTDNQPITTNEWIDRLAPKAAAVVAVGTCATYGGIPAMRNNPTGAMGLPDYLGWSWRTRSGLPIVCVPGCPSQPDNLTEVLLYLVLHVAGLAPEPELDAQLRPAWLFGRTTRESCSRAGFTEQGKFASEYGADPRCLVKLGCKGPVAKCNVPVRGWTGGVGGCPNVGGICIACTMPGFPDRFIPFMDPDPWGNAAANFQRFSYGPIFRYFRKRNLEKHFDQEPEWRHSRPELTSGYPESALRLKTGEEVSIAQGEALRMEG